MTYPPSPLTSIPGGTVLVGHPIGRLGSHRKISCRPLLPVLWVRVTTLPCRRCSSSQLPKPSTSWPSLLSISRNQIPVAHPPGTPISALEVLAHHSLICTGSIVAR